MRSSPKSYRTHERTGAYQSTDVTATPAVAQVPIGAGLGLAHKLKGENSCSFALYGDGAANQGQIAEAMNMAALWKVPVIFVCENNHYGMGTSEWRGSKSAKFFRRGDYVPGIRVDGMDALAMKQATVWAKQFVLENGPLIFEADTYRCTPGHTLFLRAASCVASMGGLSRRPPGGREALVQVVQCQCIFVRGSRVDPLVSAWVDWLKSI